MLARTTSFPKRYSGKCATAAWMRVGRWSKEIDYGESSKDNAGFPPLPVWFNGNLEIGNIADGLQAAGMSDEDTARVMGGNWLRFLNRNSGAL